jgi:hypothetical protein
MTHYQKRLDNLRQQEKKKIEAEAIEIVNRGIVYVN